MPRQKTISRTISVSTVEDGVSQPSYIEVQEAWSNQATTASASTMPSDCTESSWKAYTPANSSNRAYLWRRSRTMTLNSSTRTYTAGTWSYQRLSGTNGTSINPRGLVADASKRSSGSATLVDGTVITMANGDCVTQQDNGHLYQWVTEGSGRWIDLGVFQGEPGKTYYTHIAWATGVTLSSSQIDIPDGQQTRPNATAVTGFTIAPTSQMPWMGVLVDENTADSTTATDYTWNNVKGEQGDGGVNYEIRSAIGVIKIASDSTTGTLTVTVYFYKLQDGTLSAYSCYASAYRRKGTTYTRITRRTSKGTSMAISSAAVSSDPQNSNYADAVVVFMTDTSTGSASAAPSTYLAKLEIPVVKDGDTGPGGSDGRPGRFYYYAQEWQNSSLVSYDVTDAMAPFFSYYENYYVFNPKTPGRYTMAEMGAPYHYESIGGSQQIVYNENWEIMVNDFKYLITEAIFGSFAKFGASIINGDFLMSQYVIALGLGNTKQAVNNATKYQYCDPDDMFGEGDMYEDISDRSIFPLVHNGLIDVENGDFSESVRSDLCSLTWGGKMYSIELECFSNGADLEVVLAMSGFGNNPSNPSWSVGTIPQEYRDDNTFFSHYFFVTPNINTSSSFALYFRLSSSGNGEYAEARNIRIRRVKFVPQFCLDMKKGKMVANNIVARGQLHGGSISYKTAPCSANYGVRLVTDETIVTLSHNFYEGTVVLPEPSADNEGHVIEIFNGMKLSFNWYLSFVGFTDGLSGHQGFWNPFSGIVCLAPGGGVNYLGWSGSRYGASYKSAALDGITYIKLICKNSWWNVLKIEGSYRRDNNVMPYLINTMVPDEGIN